MPKAHKRLPGWGCLCSLFFLIAFAVIIIPALLRPLPSARSLRDGTSLKYAHLAMTTYYREHGGTAPSWLLTIHHGYLVPELFYSSYSPRAPLPFHELTLGSFTIDDLFDPDTTVEELIEEANRIVPHEPWEQLGDLLLSREIEAVNSSDSRIVAGVMLIAAKKNHKQRVTEFVFADNRLERIPILSPGSENPKYVALRDADRIARKSLGMSQPPDYAALIIAHTAEQQRLADEGK